MANCNDEKNATTTTTAHGSICVRVNRIKDVFKSQNVTTTFKRIFQFCISMSELYRLLRNKFAAVSLTFKQFLLIIYFYYSFFFSLSSNFNWNGIVNGQFLNVVGRKINNNHFITLSIIKEKKVCRYRNRSTTHAPNRMSE